MKRSTIMQRLTLLTAIPVTALVLFSGMLIWESFGRYQDVILAKKVIEAAVAAGDLIQPMQIERGMTAGFIQSKGQKFADTLPGIRAKTDEKLVSYTRIIEEMAVTEPLITAVKEARQRLDELAKTRNQASQYSISAAESSAFFTATIDKLLDVQSTAVEYNKDPAIGKRLLAYHSFSNGKEYAGQERALSMPVFAANKVEPAQYRTILNRIYKQEAYLDSFLDFASGQEKAALKSVLDGDAAKDVEDMRAAMAGISEHPDGAAGETTSHPVKSAKSSDQANGYSHFTGLSAEKLLTGQPKDNNQAAGYSSTKNAGQVVDNEQGVSDPLTDASSNSNSVISAKAGTMSRQTDGCGPLPARRVYRGPLVAPSKKLAAVVADMPAQGMPGVDPAVWFKRSTDRINGLYEVEQLVVKNIISDANILLASSRTFLLTQLILAVLAIVLAVAVSVGVARSVNRPLKAVVEAAEYAVAHDDFTRSAPEEGTQETARVGQAINRLMEKFRSIISEATRSSEGIAAASGALAASSSEVNKSSSVQANAASTVAAAVEEVSVSVSETAANARSAGEIVGKSRAGTESALAVMAETVQNVNSIAALIRESDAKVERLDESSKKIGGIIQVIREVADQTNLLALNAAIEAARAGEQGRGFAVVADEVRKLAERTSKATTEIAALIGDIQNHISETVTGMQQANTQAGESLELVGKTENALHRIGDDSREMASKVQSIVDAIHEQDAAIQQVAANIEKIAQMSEENTAAAASNSDTAAQLDRLSGALKESVIRFKV